MARTVKPTPTHKMTTRSQQAKLNYGVSVHKALLVGSIVKSFIKRDSDATHLENQILRDSLANEIETTVSLRRQIQRMHRAHAIGLQRIRVLQEDKDFMDAAMREIFVANPQICWQFRNRLTYDDIEPQDPEDAQDLYERLFGSDDDDDEDLEDRLEREFEHDL